MFSHFFIERPIFASVLSIVITLAGVAAVTTLPLAQYPPITPPSINVMCNYPGAAAQDVADSVAAPIEQQVNGVEDMMYMVSQSNNDGSYNLTVTFKPGVNLNFAQVLVQNRINLAMPLLPDVVKQAGVTTRKRNPDILMVVAILSPDGRYDQLYLSNFTTIKIKDEIARVDGVGDCQQFGQQDFSMRLWLDPDRLTSLNLNASDVANAVREQNRQIAAGHFGQPPSPNGYPFEFPITALGRLTQPEEFEEIIVRTERDGRKIRVKDIGSVKLGARNMDTTSRVDDLPNASLAIWALPDANSLATAKAVIKRLDELKSSFPEDIDYRISLDMTPFIEESIKEVIRTLIEAIVLVAIVVLVFLQNWRSAIIPLVAVPVAVVGTFAAMAAIGFSLNNLTLFGLVLAIGIVVDDAIVVVEAVEHHIEQGLSPRRAAHKAMEQVSGPVVAVALVLSAVFVPCAFISGITGQFFRQFALTIAVSTVISAFNSLTLSPALAAILLQPRGAKKDLPGRLLDFLLGWFFKLFNWTFRRGTTAYAAVVSRALRGSAVVLGVYGGLLVLTWWTSAQLPIGYIPNGDQGRFYVAVQLPDGASLERTQKVVDRVTELVKPLGGVVHTTGIAGQSFTLNANGSNFAQFFITLEDFDKRRDPAMHAFAFTDRVKDLLNAGRFKLTEKSFASLRADAKDPVPASVVDQLHDLRDDDGYLVFLGKEFLTQDLFETTLTHALTAQGIQDKAERNRIQERVVASAENRNDEISGAQLSLFTPPAVSGLGSASGFKIIIEDREDLGLEELQKQVDRVVAAGNAGRFKLTEKSFASLRADAKDPVPASVVDQLHDLRDDDGYLVFLGKEFLTQDLFETTLTHALTAQVIQNKAERIRIQERVVASAENRKVVSKLFTIFRANTPQLFVDLNRDQCQTMGVNPNDVFNTLQIYQGSLYINDFNRFGRTWQVVAQAEGEFRTEWEKIRQLQVRNAQGKMVPLGAVLSVKSVGGPINIGRYNMYNAAAILGATEPGVSTGQGIEEMEAICNETLPDGMSFEWTEINYMQIDAAKNIWNRLIFPLAVVFVFMVLAAQYESWSLPLAVILVVPMCILSSLIGVWVTKGDINIFTQIGFVVLVGLASKNAILIVEFAKHSHEEGGLSRREATLAACRLRLRPILMTSFAFILGVVPLLVTTGAGAEMRKTLGTAVFSGMLGVTLFGIFLTPVFFYVIAGFAEMPLFASERVRLAGKIMLYLVGALTLGIPWFLVLLLGKVLRRHPPAPAVASRAPVRVAVNDEPAVNGHAKHSHSNGTPSNGIKATTTDKHDVNSSPTD